MHVDRAAVLPWPPCCCWGRAQARRPSHCLQGVGPGPGSPPGDADWCVDMVSDSVDMQCSTGYSQDAPTEADAEAIWEIRGCLRWVCVVPCGWVLSGELGAHGIIFPTIGLLARPSRLRATFELTLWLCLGRAVPGVQKHAAHRPGRLQCEWELRPPLDSSRYHACHRYFNHRHIVCLRRWGLFTATRATHLHSAPEPFQRRALARPGHSGLVHLILCILHLISPGRETHRRSQCCSHAGGRLCHCTRRPWGPHPHRSVTSCCGPCASRAGSGVSRTEQQVEGTWARRHPADLAAGLSALQVTEVTQPRWPMLAFSAWDIKLILSF